MQLEINGWKSINITYSFGQMGAHLYWAQFQTVLIKSSAGNETFLFCSMIGDNTMLQLCHMVPAISV
jgi:hypothetical protein